MSEQWVKIGTYQELCQAEMVKSFLEEQGIICSLLNKKDSAYIMIGNVELLVKSVDVIFAKYIIEKLEL